MNILEAMQSPELFGDSFQGESWESWRAVLSGAFAIPMDEDRLTLFKQLAGDREPPQERVRELWCIAGRRSAKTHTAAAIAVYLATVGAELEGLTSKLSTGERGVIALLATDRTQAKTALNYIAGMLDASPVLRQMVLKQNTESVELVNNVTIEVNTANYKAVRSRTLLACIMDETAFFTDSATSTANDQEIYRAAVPGLATTGGLLIAISSPYAKRGLLYSKFRKHYGADGRVLVVKGATSVFNPTLDPQIIQDAIDEDPEAAKTEWLGEFREGISSFVDRAVIESCTRQKPLIVPPMPGIKYQAFVDPAGGGESPNSDQFTMAIGYPENGKAVICGVWGRKGSPAEITAEYAEILKTYKCVFW